MSSFTVAPIEGIGTSIKKVSIRSWCSKQCEDGNDLVKVAQDAGKSTYQLFFFLILAALIYLVITTVSNYVLRRMEIFYAAGTREAVR